MSCRNSWNHHAAIFLDHSGPGLESLFFLFFFSNLRLQYRSWLFCLAIRIDDGLLPAFVDALAPFAI